MTDDATLKARFRKAWGGVATGWEAWWPTIEQAAQPVSDRLCELAHVGDGNWVLDVASGIGEPALTAARRVGKTGKVTAVDQAPEMVAIAEKRARVAGLASFGAHALDADGLGAWPEKSYDAVLCRWGLMFMPRPEATLRTLHRLLVPGGWLAAATWAAPERAPFCAVVGDAVRAAIDWPPPPDGPGAFALSDPPALARMVAGAGFREVQGERLTVSYDFEDVAAFCRFVRECSPTGAEIAREPAERQELAWAAVATAAAPYADASGRVSLPAETILVAGRR
jgi:SAM-dependent methyltransferase